MAVDFNGQSSALNYAYYTKGNSGAGASLVTMGSDFSVFAHINMSGAPGALGTWIGGCVNMPTGFGGYNKEGMLITTDLKVRAMAGGTPGAQTADSAVIPLNTWVAAGVSISAASLKAYLDGVPGTENTTSWAGGGALEETIIGAYPTTFGGTFNRPFQWCIEDLAFWAAKLTNAQHLELASLSGDDIKNYIPAPVLYVPFLDGASAANAFLGGSPITLYFKAYNANPSDTTATVVDCDSQPPDPPPDEILTHQVYNRVIG